MRRKKGFTLHKVCNENIIVAEGRENVDFNKLITINDTAAFLWDLLGDGEPSLSDMAAALMAEYGIEQELARRDCEEITQKWLDAGIIEE